MFPVVSANCQRWHRFPRNVNNQRFLLLWRSFASSSSSSSSWTVDSETGVVSCDQQPMFQTVIGLEIHAQLDIATKLFSSAKGPSTTSSSSSSSTTTTTTTTTAPNTCVHLFDVAVPGSLPRLSKEAVQQAVRTAAALDCDIPHVSRFERKHYSYADLPHGYQVTQQRWPLARNGKLCCRSRRRQRQRQQQQQKKLKSNQLLQEEFHVDIDRIQLEQDTGKTTNFKKQKENDHQESWVDFNRAGCALVEIVMAPQLKSPRQAGIALETLRSLLIHIGTCNGRMEEGSLRCDLNISLSPIIGSGSLSSSNANTATITSSSSGGGSARVEVKNLNSIRHVVKAAEYEAKRQAQALSLLEDSSDGGGSSREKRSETRTFDASSSRTILLRKKEGEDDYRFMPEPDLPPLVLNEEVFDGKTLQEFLAETLPELPEAALARFIREYGLSQDESLVLTAHASSIRLFDQAASVAKELVHVVVVGDEKKKQQYTPKEVYKVLSNLMCNHLFALVKETTSSASSASSSSSTTTSEEDHHHDNDNDDDDDDDDNALKSNFSKLTGQQLGELVGMILHGKISNTMAKQILSILYHNNNDATSAQSPQQVAAQHGFELMEDPEQLRQICREVIAEHVQPLEDYKKGGKYIRKMEKFFLGQAMAKTKSNAHAERLREALQDVLEEEVAHLE